MRNEVDSLESKVDSMGPRAGEEVGQQAAGGGRKTRAHTMLMINEFAPAALSYV